MDAFIQVLLAAIEPLTLLLLFSFLFFLFQFFFFFFLLMESALRHAALSGDVDEVRSLLSAHPGLDVNSVDRHGWAPLHSASYDGVTEVAKLLLAHPTIEVNALTGEDQEAPILLGCFSGCVGVVRLLLEDPRVDVTLADRSGCTPLWYAACYGHYEVIEWLIASGRDFGDFENKKGKSFLDDQSHSALEIARKQSKEEAASLLQIFKDNQGQTRHTVRVKLGLLDALAAEVFALTVFCAMTFFSSSQLSTTTPPILQQLPLVFSPLLLSCPWSCR